MFCLRLRQRKYVATDALNECDQMQGTSTRKRSQSPAVNNTSAKRLKLVPYETETPSGRASEREKETDEVDDVDTIQRPL